MKEELISWAEGAQPGDFEIFREYTIEFLPPDWEKYSQFGCDTDGGNYCSYIVPVGWINPKTREPEFYLASYSSCELGNDVYIIEDKDGHLVVVKSYYLSEEEQEQAIYHPWHPDFRLRGPFNFLGLRKTWEKIYKENKEEWEAYEEWKEAEL